MAINETIVINRKWRKCIDIVNKTWQRISFWTHSSDVEFEDGMTAETKVGAIDGITDSLASNSSRIAASAKAVNSLSNDLSGCKLITEGSGTNTKYYIQTGADAASKKLLGSAEVKFLHSSIAANTTLSYTFDNNYSNVIIITTLYRADMNGVPTINNVTISAGTMELIRKEDFHGNGVYYYPRCYLLKNVTNGTTVNFSVMGMGHLLVVKI